MALRDIVTSYLVFCIPAFLMLIVGVFTRKKHPEFAKGYFIAACIYFLIGAGLCGLLLI